LFFQWTRLDGLQVIKVVGWLVVVAGDVYNWENKQVVLGFKRFSYELGNCVFWGR